MFGFNSWSDFTAKASETIKSAAEKTTEGVKSAVENSKVVASKVSTNVTKFVEEQKVQYNQIEHETDLIERRKAKKKQIMNSGKPPWFISKENSKNYESEIKILDELKLNILKLCQDENNFLIKAPSSTSVFDFKLECALPIAQAALKQDPILPKIRFKMVPKSLSEEQFWRNYFYRVNLIRENLGISKLDLATPPIATTPKEKNKKQSFPTDDEQKIDENNKNESSDNIKQPGADEPIDDVKNNTDDNNENKQTEMDKNENKNDININNKVDDENKNKEPEIKMDLSSDNIGPSSKRQVTEMQADNVDDMDLNDDEDDFLSEQIDIKTLTDEEKAKMKSELGLNAMNDIDNVDDLLADVDDEDIADISDGELENMVNAGDFELDNI